ncbi:MAG: cytochrome-c peroxidase, partial [bacterium]
MSRSSVLASFAFLLLGALAAGCTQAAPPRQPETSDTVDKAMLEMFGTLPDVVPAAGGIAAQEMVDLGRMLYFEPRLSKSQQISCNSCHDLATYGADGQPTSDGHKGQMGDRNSPSVYNAAGHFVQFWDGRAADVEEQAKGPVLNPVEMAMASEKIV